MELERLTGESRPGHGCDWGLRSEKLIVLTKKGVFVTLDSLGTATYPHPVAALPSMVIMDNSH
jgi:hypothetical protein